MSKEQSQPQPFKFLVNVRTLPRKGQTVPYEAPNDVCAEIAKAYDLNSVERFTGKVVLAPWKKDGVKIEGSVAASIMQPCAVSGEPVAAKVSEPIELIFVPDGSKLSRPKTNEEGEIIIDVDGADLPETFTGDSIDVASVMLEFFALGIDPFLRTDGASFEEVTDGYDKQADSPFAALAGLKTE